MLTQTRDLRARPAARSRSDSVLAFWPARWGIRLKEVLRDYAQRRRVDGGPPVGRCAWRRRSGSRRPQAVETGSAARRRHAAGASTGPPSTRRHRSPPRPRGASPCRWPSKVSRPTDAATSSAARPPPLAPSFSRSLVHVRLTLGHLGPAWRDSSQALVERPRCGRSARRRTSASRAQPAGSATHRQTVGTRARVAALDRHRPIGRLQLPVVQPPLRTLRRRRPPRPDPPPPPGCVGRGALAGACASTPDQVHSRSRSLASCRASREER